MTRLPATTAGENGATAGIYLREVTRTFGTTKALDGIDLELHRGVIGLLGPNGAGKTTLLRLLATVITPSRGQVRVLGLDAAVAAKLAGIRRRLGYLPQDVGFPRGFTAYGFVDYMASLKEWAHPEARHTEVRRVLDLVGLADLGRKRSRAMSRGQRLALLAFLSARSDTYEVTLTINKITPRATMAAANARLYTALARSPFELLSNVRPRNTSTSVPRGLNVSALDLWW